MKKSVFSMLCAAILCAGLCGCASSEHSKAFVHIPVSGAQVKIEYTLFEVQQGDLAHVNQISCTYKPAKKESLSFSVGGVALDQIFVTQGQQVKAGALLATLDQKSLRTKRDGYLKEREELELERQQLQQKLDLEQANGTQLLSQLQQKHDMASPEEQPAIKQQIQSTQKEIQNTITSYERKITSVEDSVYILSLRVKELEADIQKRCMYAGISGTVTYVQELMPGQRSTQGEHFITISDFSSAVFIVKGESANAFSAGDAAVVNCQNKTYDCHVFSPKSLGLSEQIDGLPCAYLKPDVPDPSLSEGQKGTIDITVSSAENAVYVVKEAIHSNDDGDYLFVLDAEDLRTLRKVTVGIVNEKYAQITKGLKPGEKVILD